VPELVEQVKRCGGTVAAQTADVVPADKRLYTTAT
jgi:thymidine phosphorylase